MIRPYPGHEFLEQCPKGKTHPLLLLLDLVESESDKSTRNQFFPLKSKTGPYPVVKKVTSFGLLLAKSILQCTDLTQQLMERFGGPAAAKLKIVSNIRSIHVDHVFLK